MPQNFDQPSEWTKEDIEKLVTNGPGAFGPTGKFPLGKLTDDDEGELRIGITTSKGNVVIDFGKNITWIGMPPEQAIQFGELIIKRAKEL